MQQSKMNFSENEQSFVIIEKLSGMRKAGDFCDIELVLDDQSFKAHRNILAASSEYFFNCFKKRKVVKEKIIVKGCKSANALQSLLNYMYSGAIVIDLTNVIGLMQLSNQFKVDKVIGYCKMYLQNHLTAANCLAAREVSIKYGFSDLERDASDFIHLHVLEILEQEEILRCTTKKLTALLEIEQSIPPLELLKFLCKWVLHRKEKRQDAFLKLLAFVNLRNLNPALLEENISQLNLLKISGQCWNGLLGRLKENDIVLSEDTLNLMDNNSSDGDYFFDTNFISDSGPNFDSDESSGAENSKKRKRRTNASYNTDTSKANGSRKTDAQRQSLQPTHKRSRKSKNPRKISTRLRRSTRSKPVPEISSNEEESDAEHISDDGSQVYIAESDDDDDDSKENSNAKSKLDFKGKIKCNKCPYATNQQEKLENHMTMFHETDRKYKCRDCSFMWTWPREYNEHLKSHYKGPPYKCPECRLTFPKVYHFARHLFTHSSSKPFKCSRCYDSFKSPKQLQDHMKEEHGIKKMRQGSGLKRDFRTAVKCDKCTFNTHSLERLQNHKTMFHTSDTKYKCRECDFMWSWTGEYTVHLKTHYSGPPFKCKECTYITGKFAHFSTHIFRHANNHQFVCDVCNEGFKALILLQRHKRRCKKDESMYETEPTNESVETTPKKRRKIVKCEKCPFATDSSEKMEHHISSLHSNDEMYKCPECDYTWKTITDYNLHVKTHFSGPPYKCDKCNFASEKVYFLASHLFVHAKDIKFKCGLCDQQFGAPQLLRNHITRRHPLTKPFKCDKCGRSYSTKCLLTEHQQNHVMEKKYLCDMCGFSTRFKRNLLAHKITHKEKNLLCDYPGCKYKTMLESVLKKHKMKHTGEGPYICSYCGKNYSTKSYLSQHEQIHLNIRFTCDTCGSTFAMRKGLRRHINTCHSSGAGSSRKSSQPRKSRLLRVREEAEEQPSCSQSVIVRPTAGSQMEGSYTTWSDSHNQQFPQENMAPICFGHMPSVAAQHMKAATEYVPAGAAAQAAVAHRGPPNVPTISHEIPTKFRSFMTFF